jgi:prohibitin 2
MRTLILWLVFVGIWALWYTLGARAVRRRGGEALPVPREPEPEPEVGAEFEEEPRLRRRAPRRRKLRLPPASTAAWELFASRVFVGLPLALLVVIALARCWVEVGPAETMAIYDPVRGGIQGRDYREGWHLLPPWVTKRTFSKRLQEYTMSGLANEGAVLGDDSMGCQTKEGLAINVDATVVFRIPADGAHRLWKAVGPDYVRIIVRPDARNVVRLVVSNYGIMEVYSNAARDYAAVPGTDFYVGKRKQIEQEIEKTLRAQFAEKGLELLIFLMRNVTYDAPQFAQAVVNKQVAQQQIVTQQFRAQAAKIHAEAQVRRAEGDAKAIQLKAQALRINSGVVDLEWIDQLKPDAVILLPGNVTPLLPLPRE